MAVTKENLYQRIIRLLESEPERFFYKDEIAEMLCVGRRRAQRVLFKIARDRRVVIAWNIHREYGYRFSPLV